MLDLINRNKTFIGIVVVTLIILFAGVFLMSKGGTQSTSTSGSNVSESILISEDSQKSDSGAALVLVEFGDYQCPACAVYHPFVKQLLSDFPGKVNFVFRHFPLPQHKNANIASYAAEAAALQGKFWEMHNKIYETQNAWSNLDNPKDTFTAYAVELGLNKDKFLSDLDSDFVKNIIKRGLSDGKLAGISATPTFYLDGSELTLFANYEDLKKSVEEKLKTL